MESGFRKIRANTGLAKQRLVFQQNVWYLEYWAVIKLSVETLAHVGDI
jgi:hypothetical protein